MSLAASLIAQRLHRIHFARVTRREPGRKEADYQRAAADNQNVSGHDQRGQLRETVNVRRKQLPARRVPHEIEELIAEMHGEQPSRKADDDAEQADDEALPEKNPQA